MVSLPDPTKWPTPLILSQILNHYTITWSRRLVRGGFSPRPCCRCYSTQSSGSLYVRSLSLFYLMGTTRTFNDIVKNLPKSCMSTMSFSSCYFGYKIKTSRQNTMDGCQQTRMLQKFPTKLLKGIRIYRRIQKWYLRFTNQQRRFQHVSGPGQ